MLFLWNMYLLFISFAQTSKRTHTPRHTCIKMHTPNNTHPPQNTPRGPCLLILHLIRQQGLHKQVQILGIIHLCCRGGGGGACVGGGRVGCVLVGGVVMHIPPFPHARMYQSTVHACIHVWCIFIGRFLFIPVAPHNPLLLFLRAPPHMIPHYSLHAHYTYSHTLVTLESLSLHVYPCSFCSSCQELAGQRTKQLVTVCRTVEHVCCMSFVLNNTRATHHHGTYG